MTGSNKKVSHASLWLLALCICCIHTPGWALPNDDIARLFGALNSSLIEFLHQLKTPLYIAEGLSGAYCYFKTKNVFSLLSVAALALFLNAMLQYVGG